MVFDPEEILSVLDRCCQAFAFPMLDNGHIYLAAAAAAMLASPELDKPVGGFDQVQVVVEDNKPWR